MSHPRAVLQTQLDIVVLACDFERGSDDWAQSVMAAGIAHSAPLVQWALDPISILCEAESDDSLHAVVSESNLLGMECIRPGAGVHLGQSGACFELGQTNPFSPTKNSPRTHSDSSGRGRPPPLLEPDAWEVGLTKANVLPKPLNRRQSIRIQSFVLLTPINTRIERRPMRKYCGEEISSLTNSIGISICESRTSLEQIGDIW